MALVYNASIRSSNEHQARFLAGKYHGQGVTFNVPGSLAVTFARMRSDSRPDSDGDGFWTEIGVLEITKNGISTPDEADKASQFDNILYGMLRNEAHFDYALIGVEIGEFRNLKQLAEDFQDGSVVKMTGTVIRTDLIRSIIGEKAVMPPYPDFQPFSKTHWWIPKTPEVCHA